MSKTGAKSRKHREEPLSHEEHEKRFLGARTMATAFANTAAFLYERDLKQPVSRKPFHVVPFIVNASFAVELFLKALGHRYGVRLGGHELLSLFEELPLEAAMEVQAASARVAVSTEPPQFQNSTVALTELNSAFVDWRYTHEKKMLGPINLESVVLLVKVMHEACGSPSGA